MAALGFTMTGAGLVLVWAGIRNENAVTLVLDVLAGRRKPKAAAKPSTTSAPIRREDIEVKPGWANR